MSIEARFVNDAACFKRLIDAVKEIVNEVILDCNPSGMELKALDSSHVALVMFCLPCERAFSYYKCPHQASMGINIQALKKVLNLCNNEDILTMNKPENSDILDILFESKDGSRISQFSLNLVDIDQNDLTIPIVEYQTYFSFSSSEFSRICKEFKELADTIVISSQKNCIKFSFKSDTTSGEVSLLPTIQMSDSNQPPTTITIHEPTSAAFSSKYLMMFTKGFLLSQSTSFSLSSNIPLIVEFHFAEGYLKYYMAPKIEE